MKCFINRAEIKLTPTLVDRKDGNIVDPLKFNVNIDNEGIDPFIHFADVPKMEYLEISKDNTLLNQEERDLINNEEEM